MGHFSVFLELATDDSFVEKLKAVHSYRRELFYGNGTARKNPARSVFEDHT